MNANEVLEVVAGERCPCGHLKSEHAPPDPDWKVGDLRQTSGDCSVCDCRGTIA